MKRSSNYRWNYYVSIYPGRGKRSTIYNKNMGLVYILHPTRPYNLHCLGLTTQAIGITYHNTWWKCILSFSSTSLDKRTVGEETIYYDTLFYKYFSVLFHLNLWDTFGGDHIKIHLFESSPQTLLSLLWEDFWHQVLKIRSYNYPYVLFSLLTFQAG